MEIGQLSTLRSAKLETTLFRPSNKCPDEYVEKHENASSLTNTAANHNFKAESQYEYGSPCTFSGLFHPHVFFILTLEIHTPESNEGNSILKIYTGWVNARNKN